MKRIYSSLLFWLITFNREMAVYSCYNVSNNRSLIVLRTFYNIICNYTLTKCFFFIVGKWLWYKRTCCYRDTSSKNGGPEPQNTTASPEIQQHFCQKRKNHCCGREKKFCKHCYSKIINFRLVKLTLLHQCTSSHYGGPKVQTITTNYKTHYKIENTIKKLRVCWLVECAVHLL